MVLRRLFIIDAMAMAFRNFHAFGVKPLTTSKGLPTSAVFGCAIQLMKLVQDEKPDYLAVATDNKTPTFRHQLFPAYKANRSQMPEDLAVQLPYLFRLFKAFGFPLLNEPGVEADDLIGTIVTRHAAEDLHCFIVSGDKDFMQLVDDKVKIYSPQKGDAARIIDQSGVMEKFGCRPDQVVDILSLIGDSSDNVPGVRGIGDKGASQLISQFGSLDGIYANLDSITNKRQRESLQQNREMAYLSKKLVTINTAVPIDLDLEKMAFKPLSEQNRQDLLTLYEELEFRVLHQKLQAVQPVQAELPFKPAAKSAAPASVSDPTTENYDNNSHKGDESYIVVQDRHALDSLVDALMSVTEAALNTETTGLDKIDDRPIGISFAVSPGKAFYVPLLQRDLNGLSPGEVLGALKPWLTSESHTKIGHNLKFEWQMLANLGVVMNGPYRDTMLASYLLDAIGRDHSLEASCLKHLNYRKIPTTELLGAKNLTPMQDVALPLLSRYAMEDADLALRLHRCLTGELSKQGLTAVYENCECPLLAVIATMEQRGIFVDTDVLTEISGQLAVQSKTLEEEIYQAAGETFNINSPKQLQTILFEKLKVHELLGIKRLKKTQSGYSTDVTVLEKLADHPLPRAILSYRSVTKLKNTYVDTLPQLINQKTGRIHTSFHQALTATGRLSSSDPNLQNIPIRTEMGQQIRRAFAAQTPDHVLISADYSQIELRVLAHLAKEDALAEAFRSGADIHTDTAARIFNIDRPSVDATMRSRAKAINFGIIYGMGPQRLARQTNVTVEEAKRFIERYFATYPQISNFIDRTLAEAREKGYTTTILGRRRGVPELFSKEPQVIANGENIAVNSPVQGSAADLIKLAMLRIEKRLSNQGKGARMLLQVHDELVFECKETYAEETAAIIKYEMEHAMELTVPLLTETGIGKNWLEAH